MRKTCPKPYLGHMGGDYGEKREIWYCAACTRFNREQIECDVGL